MDALPDVPQCSTKPAELATPPIVKTTEDPGSSIDCSRILLNKVEEFESWLIVNSGKAKDRCRECRTQVQKMLLSVIRHQVPDIITLSNLLESEWLGPSRKSPNFSAKTIKNYIYSFSKFCVYIEAKTEINMIKMTSNMKLWAAALNKPVAVQTNEHKAKGLVEILYISFVLITLLF